MESDFLAILDIFIVFAACSFAPSRLAEIVAENTRSPESSPL